MGKQFCTGFILFTFTDNENGRLYNFSVIVFSNNGLPYLFCQSSVFPFRSSLVHVARDPGSLVQCLIDLFLQYFEYTKIRWVPD